MALPSEHGGWGLTFEPVLLGLLVSWSWAGLAVGAAAMLAFLVRTPLKLIFVDRRRHRSLPRTRLAARVAAVELVVLGVLGALAVVGAGWSWLVPVAVALPLFAVELWFDVRSRGRRLVPELCGGVGIAAASAAIVLAGGGAARLAIGVWLILAARAVALDPVRADADSPAPRRGRRSRRATPSRPRACWSPSSPCSSKGPSCSAWPASPSWRWRRCWWVRRPVPPAKQLGLLQLALGLGLVVVTAAGVLAWT